METVGTLFLTTVFVFTLEEILRQCLKAIREKRNYKSGKWKKGYKRK